MWMELCQRPTSPHLCLWRPAAHSAAGSSLAGWPPGTASLSPPASALPRSPGKELRFIPRSAGAMQKPMFAYPHNFRNRGALYTWTLTPYVILWVCILPKACQPCPFTEATGERSQWEENAGLQLGLRVPEGGSGEKKVCSFKVNSYVIAGAS